MKKLVDQYGRSVNKDLPMSQAFDVPSLISSLNLTANQVIQNPYMAHHLIYRGIQVVVQNSARSKLTFYKTGDENKTPVLDHPLITLLNKPNAIMDRMLFMSQTMLSMKLEGECFWADAESLNQAAGINNIPASLMILPPKQMRYKTNDVTGAIERWVFSGKTQTPLDPECVTHFKDPNPYNMYRGISPLAVESVKLLLKTDYNAMKYNDDFLKFGGLPKSILKFDQSMSETQIEKIVKQWKASLQQGNKLGVLIGDMMEYMNVGVTHQDLDFLDSRKYTRDELLCITGVSSGVLGFDENLSYASLKSLKQLLWTETIIPMQEIVLSVLNTIFCNRYAPELQCFFDRSDIIELQEDLKDRVDHVVKLVTIGVPLNEAMKRFSIGIDDVKGGDIGLVTFNMTSLEEAGQPDPEPEPEPDPDDSDKAFNKQCKATASAHKRLQKKEEAVITKKMKKFFMDQRKVVMSSMFKSKDIKSVHKKDIDALMVREDTRLQKVLKPLLLATMDHSIDLAIGELSSLPDVIDPDVLANKLNYIVDARLEGSVKINETTYDKIKHSIAQGVEAGDTPKELALRVTEIYDSAIKNRSLMIGITESNGMIGETTFGVYRENKVKKKAWLNSSGNVRPSHVACMRQGAIGLKKRFGNGLLHPGDSAGDASELCNCHCALVPVI